MSNLKKPIFWAWAVLLLYMLLLSTFVALFIANSIWEKLLFVILDVSLVLVVVFRYPKMINEPRAATFPLVTGIIWTLVGGFVMFVLLIKQQPLFFSEPEYSFPVVVALMFPFGIVILLLTVLNLKSKKTFPPK